MKDDYPYRCHFCGAAGQVTIDSGELTGKYSCLECYKEWEKAGRPERKENGKYETKKRKQV